MVGVMIGPNAYPTIPSRHVLRSYHQSKKDTYPQIKSKYHESQVILPDDFLSPHIELLGPGDVLSASVASHVKRRHDSLDPLARLGALRQLRNLRRVIVGRIVLIQDFTLGHGSFLKTSSVSVFFFYFL